jgi:hypothetical protein
MEFLAHNWIYLLALILFVVMHLVGSGCGYGHGKSRHDRDRSARGVAGSKQDRAHS